MPHPRLSTLAAELRGSSILEIAGEIRAHAAAGHAVLDLTVGDYSSGQFRIPRDLEDGIAEALRAGETTYPAPAGVEALRRAICGFYLQALRRAIEPDSVLVTAGARPAIYALYRALVDPGDRVVFGVPGWNNDYYCALTGATQVPVAGLPADGFLPSAAALRPHLRGARLLALNSPLNPSGASFSADQLAAIADAVLEENLRRGSGERPLYLFYDQIYWMLALAGVEHVDPIGLRPALAPYVVTIDGISKVFAATGLRVGWAVGPPELIRAMNHINGHVGAWAPRPEQIATSRLLADHAAVDRYVATMRRKTANRLGTLHTGLLALRDAGLPVDCLPPQGAIYASARFALHGRQTAAGQRLQTDDDIRRFLLHAAGLGAVPFGAFGAEPGQGWFRLSIGAVSIEQIRALMPRLQSAIASLR